MRLYATTTSERASKGQGGNEYIKVVITDENKENLMVIAIAPYKDEIGPGTRAEIKCADHLYTKIYGQQVELKGNKPLCTDGACWNRGDEVNCGHQPKGNKQQKARVTPHLNGSNKEWHD